MKLTSESDSVLQRYQSIQQEIAEAKSRAPHQRAVQLVCVSKRQPVERINELLAGVGGEERIILGENYVQEYREKRGRLLPHRVHAIGALQTNKAQSAVELFDCIESVHSEKLLRALEKEALKQRKSLPIYLQVNISGDQQKSGFSAEAVTRLLAKWPLEGNFLSLRGLMTITALYENAEDARPDFRRMYSLSEELFSLYPEVFGNQPPELSMGMSADFQIAVAEGATSVRVGSALFGERIWPGFAGEPHSKGEMGDP